MPLDIPAKDKALLRASVEEVFFDGDTAKPNAFTAPGGLIPHYMHPLVAGALPEGKTFETATKEELVTTLTHLAETHEKFFYELDSAILHKTGRVYHYDGYKNHFDSIRKVGPRASTDILGATSEVALTVDTTDPTKLAMLGTNNRLSDSRPSETELEARRAQRATSPEAVAASKPVGPRSAGK